MWDTAAMLSPLVAIALGADLTVGPTGTYATIEDAFAAAADGDRVLVEPGLYLERELDAGSRTLVVEATSKGVTLQSRANRRAFSVAGGDLTVNGFTVDLEDNVGLVNIDGGRFEVRDSQVLSARAPVPGQPGGSIDATDATVVVTNSLLDGAISPVKDGGHVYGIRTDVVLDGATVQGGRADQGGVVYLSEGSFTATDSTIRTSGADTLGAVMVMNGPVTLTDVTLDGNSAGAVVVSGGDVTITRATVRSSDAGAVLVSGGSVVATDSVFEDNVGGALLVDGGTVSVTGGSFSRNAGGTVVANQAVAVDGTTFDANVDGALTVTGADVDVTNGSFTGNLLHGVSVVGGGLTVADSSFDGTQGRAIAVDTGPVSLTDTTFTANLGGAVLANGGAVTGSGLVFTGNTGDDGVAVLAVGGDVSLVGARFEGNAATLADVVRCDGGASCVLEDPVFESNSGAGALLAVRGAAAELTGAVACLQAGPVSFLSIEGAGSADVSGSVFLANAASGPGIAVGAGSSLTMVNNSMVLQQVGSAMIDADGAVTLTNNLVASVSSTAEAVRARGGLSGGYNLYYANSGGDVAPAPLATDVVDTDPLIGTAMVGVCDLDVLKPHYGSPLVDAGDPSIVDNDGSPSDIGAFGGKSPLPDPGEDADLDDDGFSSPTDCDDTDPLVSPAQPETLCNGIDDDCDPLTEDDVDGDGDGVGQCEGDCDDEDARVFEIVDVYLDQDFDGYGIGDPTPFCLPPNNSAPLDGDCDDKDPTVYPGAADVPYDGIDQDCDGEDLDDLDGDGVLGAYDCDDEDAGRSPRLEEIPDDGIDQDCSGNDQITTLSGGAGWRCGCSATGPAGGVGLLPLLLAVALRRRRP